MFFKKTLPALLLTLILYGSFLYTMESTHQQTIVVNHTDSATKPILALLNNYFTINKVPSANYELGTINLEYVCNPKKEYNFSSFVYELYDLGYQAACGTYLQQNICFENTLKKLTEELTTLKQQLTKRELDKVTQTEIINDPNLKESSIKAKNKNNNFKYLKYFGSALTGAGIMGLGVYCYWLFKKIIW